MSIYRGIVTLCQYIVTVYFWYRPALCTSHSPTHSPIPSQ